MTVDMMESVGCFLYIKDNCFNANLFCVKRKEGRFMENIVAWYNNCVYPCISKTVFDLMDNVEQEGHGE